MGNNLDFILKLTDLFSPALRAAGSVNDQVCSRIAAGINQVNASSRQMASSVNELRARLEAVNQVRFSTRISSEFNNATRQARELEKQIERLENKGQRGSGGGMLGSIVGGNLISSLIGRVGNGIASGGRAIIGGASQQDRDLTGLTTFLGASGAKDAYKNIKSDAAATPFDTAGLLSVNRSLISAGLSAKDARRDTMNLANAISAVGGGNDELSRMAANMQQIKTVGKATAMDVRQFGYAGINIYKILADATGKSIDQVKNMDVSYDLLSKSLQRAAEKGGAYFGAMEAQSKTLPGKWSTFMDNIQNKAADIGTSLKPLLMFFLDAGIAITNNMGMIMPYVQPVVDILNTIPGIIDGINSPSSQWHAYMVVIRSVLGAAWETVKSILAHVWHIVSGVIEWVGHSRILKDVFWAIGTFAQATFWFIQKIGDAILWIWDHVMKPIIDGIDRIYGKIKDLLHLGSKAEFKVVNNGPALPGVPTSPAAGINPISINGDRSSKVSDKEMGAVTKSKARSINEGGQRSITITIGKQIEKLEVHVMDAKEGVNEIEAMVREAMRRVLYSVNGVATN